MAGNAQLLNMLKSLKDTELAMGEKRGMKALELWCKRVTDGYPGVKVENMTTSWRDGLAFCALIHHFRPDLIDFSSLKKSNIYGNNELAFRTAERHLGIPALLDAEDMVEYEVPDRLSILTYLSQFYQTFSSHPSSPVKRSPNSPDRSLAVSLSPSVSVSTPPSKEVRRREPCFVCGLPVFLAQRLLVGGHLYHRTCFRCARCRTQLTLANCYETQDGAYCCETCPDEEMGVDDIGDKGGGPASDLYIDSTPPPPPPPADTLKTDPLVTARSTSMVKMRRMLFEDIMRADDDKPPPTKRPSGLVECELISDERDEQPKSACSDKESGKSSDRLGQSDRSVESDFSASISCPAVESDKNNEIIEKETSDIRCDLNNSTSADCTPEIVIDRRPENISETIELGKESDGSHPDINKSDVTEVSSQSKLSVALENSSDDRDLFIVQATNEVLNNYEEEIEYSKLVESKESILVEASNYVALDESSSSTFELDLKSADSKTINVSESKEEKEVVIPNVEEDTRNEDEFTSLTNDIEQLAIAAANEELIKACEENREIHKKDNVSDEKDETTGETVSSDPKPPVPTVRIVKHKPPIPKSTKTLAGPSETKPPDDYPDDLNPFGDDDEEETTKEVKKDHSTSLNPFGSSDEEEEEAKQEPVKLTPPKPKERRVVPVPQSLNPFWSGDEEEEEESLPPVPKPRKLRTPQLSPEPSPRRLRPSTGSLGSATSLASRKKKPAPPPPNMQTSTGTLSSRKSYSAPKPPPAASPPPPLPTSSPPSSPLLANNEDSLPYYNRTRQNSIVSTCSSVSSAVSYTPHKSTYGQWKRKKGPAPARPVPVRRAVAPMPLAAVRQELADIEIKQQGLERQGVKLEQTIRDKFEQEGATISPYVEEMVLQLFELVNEKNELFRRQAELMYLRRQHNLEEEHAELEYQIRCLMLCPERNKTDSDKAREEQLIQRLVEVVERRNEIVDCLEMDRLREREEDNSIGAQLGIFSAAVGSEVDLRTKSDKKSKKSKEKKEKRWSRRDVDTESEDGGEKKKSKKRWFTLPRHSAHKS